MAEQNNASKDRPKSPAARIAPRQTAASAARAALIASKKLAAKSPPNKTSIRPINSSYKSSAVEHKIVCEIENAEDYTEPKSKSSSLSATVENTNLTTDPSQPRLESLSRPATPLRSTTPTREVTQMNSSSLTRSKVSMIPVKARSISKTRNEKEEDELKAKHDSRVEVLNKLKGDLDSKQREIIQVHHNLLTLSNDATYDDKLISVKNKECVEMNGGGWTEEEIKNLYENALKTFNSDNEEELLIYIQSSGESNIHTLHDKLKNLPENFTELCVQSFTSRQEITDWIKELISKTGDNEDTEDVNIRLNKINEQGLMLMEYLKQQKLSADETVEEMIERSRNSIQERSALVSVGQKLVREVTFLRSKLDEFDVELENIKRMTNKTKPDEDLHKNLEVEREAKAAALEKQGSLEQQLRQSRARVTKMDRQLREAEASIATLTATVKSLEDQNRQREAVFETRARKLKESIKTGELSNNNLLSQCNILNAEIVHIREKAAESTKKYEAEIKDLKKNLADLKSVLDQESQLKSEQAQLRYETEIRLDESHKEIKELQHKVKELELIKKLTDEMKRKEINMCAELESTKESLKITEEELTVCMREKVRFLETLTKISDGNKVEMQQKLAAELITLEESNKELQCQIRDLARNARLNEQKVQQYEEYIQNIRSENEMAKDNGKDNNQASQEVTDLKIKLMDAVHKNEKLSEALAQKNHDLERQEKSLRAQAKIIKVREEFIENLKKKECDQTRELHCLHQDVEQRMKIINDVNQQINARSEEIQELFMTLESKQQQIQRLEKIVYALEEQQRRAQAQRTRHEEKIAVLEHELAASGNKRERKYLLF